MYYRKPDYTKRSHVRFLFTSKVVTCPLSEHANFQEVATKLNNLLQSDYGDLVSVVVVLKPERNKSLYSMISKPMEAPASEFKRTQPLSHVISGD